MVSVASTAANSAGPSGGSASMSVCLAAALTACSVIGAYMPTWSRPNHIGGIIPIGAAVWSTVGGSRPSERASACLDARAEGPTIRRRGWCHATRQPGRKAGGRGRRDAARHQTRHEAWAPARPSVTRGDLRVMAPWKAYA